MKTKRIIFPDQLGNHFINDHDGEIIILISKEDMWARKMHRAKAQWWLSAIWHKKEELGKRCQVVEVNSVKEFVDKFKDQASVIAPTSYRARKAFLNKNNFINYIYGL